MKKLFFAVGLTLGSFMFINAQVQPQDDPENVATEVQEEVVSIEAQEAAEVDEAIQVTEDQQSDAVVEEESAVEE